VTDTVVVGGGGSKSEVRWRLVCDDNEIVGETLGRSPYSQSVTIPACTSCTVFMKDTYGDGWQRGTWVGFNQTYTGPTDAQDSDWVSETFTSTGCPANDTDSANATAEANSTAQPAAMVYSNVTVGGGSWKQEVRWSISCGDREYVSEEDGRAPYEERVGLPACTECTLAMRDTSGDGWSGN
jgi:hypothetical protein